MLITDMVRPTSFLSISMAKIATFIVSLPLTGLLFAVLYSIFFDFENSTATHCKVTNYLPSVSAAIALTPQAYVWRFNIAVHTTPRYLAAFLYWAWHNQRKVDPTKILAPFRKLFVVLTVGANLVELTALLCLTIISSTENHGAHEASFILFMIGSLTCMISSCLLNTITMTENDIDRKSKRRKLISLTVHVLSFIAAIYFFFRHNSKCEAGVYSLFALSEYIVIVSNMAFHYQISLDFAHDNLQVSGQETEKIR